MPIPSLLQRYLFREIFVAFLFCLVVFLLAGLVAGFLPLLQKGMEAGMDITLILFQVLVNALPGVLVTALPLAIMIGILLGLGRMATDNEISAIKASGISIYHLLPPVACLGLLGVALSLVCTLYLIPAGVGKGRLLMQEAMSRRAHAGIEERTFFDALKGLILYVEKIDPATGVMEHVFIKESSQPNETTTIIAKKGSMQPDPQGKAVLLRLYDGTIIKEDKQGDSAGVLAFETYLFRYEIDPAMLAQSRTFEEMSIAEIRQKVAETTVPRPDDTPEAHAYYARVCLFAEMLIVQRLVYPLACLALALAAFPLGIINMGKSRMNNVSAGLVAVFIYYALVLATERAARSGLAHPLAVLPLPPTLFICASAYLVARLNKERLPMYVQSLSNYVFKIKGLRHLRKA